MKNNYIVQTISDRYFLKSNRSIIRPFNSNSKFWTKEKKVEQLSKNVKKIFFKLLKKMQYLIHKL